jgi:hypothetical protein
MKKYEGENFIKIKMEKFYEFQDFCLGWNEKMKKMEKTRQVMYIMKEIDLFKSIFVVLRNLASGILEREHWREFWVVVKAERGYLEELKLGTMLNFGRNIMEEVNKVQDIVSRAQGEAVLSEALK